MRIYSRIGASVPLYSSAVGKAMLAYMQPQERENLLRQVVLQRRTPNTVGSLQELSAILKRVRRQGYAYDLEENELHIGVCAPIRITTAQSIPVEHRGPAVRMSTTRLRQLAPLVKEAGLKISRDLGYQVKEESTMNELSTPSQHRKIPARRSAIAR